MPPMKLDLASQIGIYRQRNLRKLAESSVHKQEGTVAKTICRPVSDLLDAALRAGVSALQWVGSESKPGGSRQEPEGRNTTPDEMRAAKFDVDRALKALSKLKGGNNRQVNAQQRATYSTMASIRMDGRQAASAGNITRHMEGFTRFTQSADAACSSALLYRPDAQGHRRRFSSSSNGSRKMNQNAVPADRFSRVANIAGLMFNVASTTAKQAVQRYMQGERGNVIQQAMASDENVKLLVDCLCKMRGTALKFGQLLSLQYGILPESIRRALVDVRHRADVMPEEQVIQILRNELGDGWRDKFEVFDLQPMASASLGQVHSAITKDGRRVCVKVQFPGVADSIDSDVANLIFICTKTNLIPKNFFIKQFARELKVELTTECDYGNEASFYKIFKQLQLEGFSVPDVIDEVSTRRVITTEFVPGVPVEDCKHLPQHVRDSIGDRLLRISLSELFIFGLMNTDPNPSNYLYDEKTDLIGLIDFGSCRSFNPDFVTEYSKLVLASVDEDTEKIVSLSRSLGFLGDEDTDEMVRHHVESVLITGEPFRHDGRFDFRKHDIIQQCREKASFILKLRKQPPPPEVYSLHRKLAGCYVICQLLGAHVDAKNIFETISQAL